MSKAFDDFIESWPTLDDAARRALAVDRLIEKMEARRAEAEREAYIPEDFNEIPHARGGNSDGLHVTQVAVDESDRHSASFELDGTQKRNGCVPQTDMPRTDAATAEVSSASALEQHRQHMDKHLRIVSDMVEYEPDYRDELPSDVRAELERYR